MSNNNFQEYKVFSQRKYRYEQCLFEQIEIRYILT